MSKSAIVRTRHATFALLCAFFLTGATALIFEVVWARLLLLLLGTTPMAMGIVLGAFMGGMAVGSWSAGRALIRRLEPSFEGLKLLGQIAERDGDRRRARHVWRLALATGGDAPQRALVQALLFGVEPA